ncbi:hypothetical protein H4582DRAFT_1944279 [Lactarius indigo]|nr:hypothetical protein H4582DRAFT_1944279 [Lactarius indigo]
MTTSEILHPAGQWILSHRPTYVRTIQNAFQTRVSENSCSMLTHHYLSERPLLPRLDSSSLDADNTDYCRTVSDLGRVRRTQSYLGCLPRATHFRVGFLVYVVRSIQSSIRCASFQVSLQAVVQPVLCIKMRRLNNNQLEAVPELLQGFHTFSFSLSYSEPVSGCLG